MLLHLLRILLKWGLSLGLLSGVAIGLFLIHTKMRSELDRERGKSATETSSESKQDFVELEEDEAERYGLKTESAGAVRWYPRVSVYGRIVPNPQATSEVRSPFAGRLRPIPKAPPLALGHWVHAGQTLGRVDVRVGPEVRLDLENKLADARIRQRGAEKEVKLQQDRADSLRKVTSQLQLQSRAELDAALIQLAQAKNQLATAKAAAELLQKALEEIRHRTEGQNTSWSEPLAAPIDGEVTVLAGRPGMAVEAGALVLTLVDFRHPLIRLDIPPEILALGGPPRKVEVQFAAASLSSLDGILTPPQVAKSVSRVEAHLVGPAPHVDVTSQFVSYWYEARLPSQGGRSDARWRPGMQITAEVRAEGAVSQEAVAVLARAVLYHEGRPLVYVRTGPDKYRRREVRLLGRDGERWIVSARKGDSPVGVTAGEAVVSHQAQVLLSKEFLRAVADDD